MPSAPRPTPSRARRTGRAGRPSTTAGACTSRGPTGGGPERAFQYRALDAATIGWAFTGDPPAAGRGRLFTVDEGRVQAHAWRGSAFVPVWAGGADTPGSPLLLGDHVIAGSESNASGCLRALDARTGEQRWGATLVPGSDTRWVGRAVPAGDLLLVPTSTSLVALRTGEPAPGDGTCPAVAPAYAAGWDPDEPLAPWPGARDDVPLAPAQPTPPTVRLTLPEAAYGALRPAPRSAPRSLAGTWTGTTRPGRHAVRLVVRTGPRFATLGIGSCTSRLTLRRRAAAAFELRGRRTAGSRRRCLTTTRVTVRATANGRLVTTVQVRGSKGRPRTERATLRRR